jgi:hypothetical protein
VRPAIPAPVLPDIAGNGDCGSCYTQCADGRTRCSLRHGHPARLRTHILGDTGGLRCILDDARELAGGDGLGRVLTGKQPPSRQHHALVPALPPPVSQQRQKVRRQHGVAIPAAFAAFNADQHAVFVDIAHFERGHLGDPQARAIGNSKGGTMLEAFGGSQQPCHFVRTQYGR